VTGFHWGSLDFMWYIEGMRGSSWYARQKGAKTDSGFHDVETFLNIPPHDYAGVQSIEDFVAGKKTTGHTPLSLADLIERDVDAAAKTLDGLGEVDDKELRLTMDDIRTVCEMGRYYADKIRGATYVALARETRSGADREKAIAALSRAVGHYKGYVTLVTANHVGQIWFNRVGTLNFENQIDDAEHDLNLARQIQVK
jgi:hypothetical protein